MCVHLARMVMLVASVLGVIKFLGSVDSRIGRERLVVPTVAFIAFIASYLIALDFSDSTHSTNV